MALEEIREGRISKAQKVKDTGEIVYPAISRRSSSLSEIIKFDGIKLNSPAISYQDLNIIYFILN